MDTTNYLLKFKVGSVACGLSTDKSDLDHKLLVDPKLYTDDIDIDDIAHFTKDGIDYFVGRLDGYVDPTRMCGIVTVPEFDPSNMIDSKSPRLAAYWREYGPEIMDAYPLVTYGTAIVQAEKCIGYHRYDMAVNFIGRVACRMETGRMLTAYKLDDHWRELYHKAKTGEIDESDVVKLLNGIRADTYRKYYESLPVNTEIIEEFTGVIRDTLVKTEVM